MTFIPTIAKTIAARVWNELPGDAPDKAHLLKAVFEELRSVRDMALIDHRRANRIHATHKARTTTEHMIGKLVGGPVTKGHHFRVPILGINTPVIDVFAMAATPDHPLQPACQAFLDEHRLTLTVLDKPPGKKGRAPTIITQAPLPISPAEILEKGRVKMGQMLERRDGPQIIDTPDEFAGFKMPDVIPTRFMGRDCTAGIVTDFPAEAIERLERRSDEAE